jgi:Skp family chaperone for outer membrane proteins
MGQNWRIFKRCLVLLFLSLPNTSLAQTFPVFEDNAAIGIVDQDALFTASIVGKTILSNFELAGKQLTAENFAIQEGLEEDERALTDARNTLDKEEFQKLATAFDKRVKRIRSEQATKERDLSLQLSRERAKFYETITPILLSFLEERGIGVLLNKDTVVLAIQGSDITQAAIQRINEVLNK